MRLTFLSLLFLATATAFGQTILNYNFESYKVDLCSSHKAKIDFSSNPFGEQHLEDIKFGYENGQIDFGGHFITIIWSCGTGCPAGVIVDISDGKIYELPLGETKAYFGCDEKEETLYTFNSNLYVTTFCTESLDTKNQIIRHKTYFINVWDDHQKEFKLLNKIDK